MEATGQNYQPRVERALGSKGLWRHALGTTTAPKLYEILAGVPVLTDGKTPATEEQIEQKKTKMQEYERREYLAQHVILSTTSTCLGSKIKNLKTVKEMWEAVKSDVTMKSLSYILDAEDQLASMKLTENEDPKAHLAEMKQHFQLMIQRRDNLTKMGSELSDTRFNMIIMSSLPESHRPTLQTITAAERADALTGGLTNKMKADDLIAFLMEEAQHRVINTERSKNSEQALAAQAKRKGKGKAKERAKGVDKALSVDSDVTCYNCNGKGHKQQIAGQNVAGRKAKVHVKRKRARKPKQQL
jgi:hypothetical protein